jgi:D-alanine-D-alanine ligase
VRSPAAPAVVFVDHAKWDCFFQLAARIRREGVRVVRVSTTTGWHHRAVAGLVFDRFVQVDGIAGLARIDDVLADEEVVDLQATEPVLPAVVQALGTAPAAVRHSLARRLALSDKLAARDLMAGCGGHVPDAAVLDDRSAPAEVVERLGLPLVVKPRRGASGSGVRVARTLGELEVLARAGDWYAEHLVAGAELSYGAMIGPHGVEQELLTRAWRRRGRALGPMSEHETVDDGAISEVCRRVVLATGCRGPAQIDAVVDGAGVPWLLDLNLRAWGDVGASLATGIDLAQGYLVSLGLRDAPPDRSQPPAGIRYSAFPTDLAEELAGGHPLAALGCFRRAARPYGRWFGTRYLLAEAISSVFLVHVVIRDSLRARRRRAGWP